MKTAAGIRKCQENSFALLAHPRYTTMIVFSPFRPTNIKVPVVPTTGERLCQKEVLVNAAIRGRRPSGQFNSFFEGSTRRCCIIMERASTENLRINIHTYLPDDARIISAHIHPRRHNQRFASIRTLRRQPVPARPAQPNRVTPASVDINIPSGLIVNDGTGRNLPRVQYCAIRSQIFRPNGMPRMSTGLKQVLASRLS